jgi:hypothetical protein
VLTVEPDELGLRWRETGTLTWDGRQLAAERTLAVRPVDGRWWLTFADGGLFHPWVIGEPLIHPCAADTYRGLIECRGPSSLRITWDVTGPSKDQLIVSRLVRDEVPFDE